MFIHLFCVWFYQHPMHLFASIAFDYFRNDEKIDSKTTTRTGCTFINCVEKVEKFQIHCLEWKVIFSKHIQKKREMKEMKCASVFCGNIGLVLSENFYGQFPYPWPPSVFLLANWKTHLMKELNSLYFFSFSCDGEAYHLIFISFFRVNRFFLLFSRKKRQTWIRSKSQTKHFQNIKLSVGKI